ncbi:UNVERIFIED_CONTAM: hypothetical protein Sindi_1827200 [Sesamum indicum]
MPKGGTGGEVRAFGAENLKLREDRKEAAATLEFPDTVDGQHYLEGYWASCLEQFRKSEVYQREFAKIAGPYFKHGFVACKEQFKVHGYPPSGEEPSFLDISTALCSCSRRRQFRQYTRRGRGRSEGSPPQATIDSIAGDLSRVGARKEGDTPKDVDACLPETFATVTSE